MAGGSENKRMIHWVRTGVTGCVNSLLSWHNHSLLPLVFRGSCGERESELRRLEIARLIEFMRPVRGNERSLKRRFTTSLPLLRQ